MCLETRLSTSSVAAEKDGFMNCLAEAKRTFPCIRVVTTDGHLGIAAQMRKETDIEHNQV